MTGELKKFLIEAYTSPQYDGSPVDSFAVMFNPDKYTLKYEVEYHDAQGRGTSASPQVFGNIKPREYNFEFIIDGTGASAEKKDVESEVDKFLTVAGKHDGEIHRPRYLKLSWGSLISKCVLKSAEVTYNLFKPDGTPLRAKIACNFSENIEDTLRAASERNASADLTHYRFIKSGDRLPIEVYRTYRDLSYYIQVARINGLKNFRKLQSGMRLILPMISSQSDAKRENNTDTGAQ
jgi:hypothetical protein